MTEAHEQCPRCQTAIEAKNTLILGRQHWVRCSECEWTASRPVESSRSGWPQAHGSDAIPETGRSIQVFYEDDEDVTPFYPLLYFHNQQQQK